MGAILEAAYHTYLEQGTILGARDTAVTKLFFLTRSSWAGGGTDKSIQIRSFRDIWAMQIIK